MLPKGGTVIPNGANLNSTAYLKVGNYYQSAIVNTTNMTNIPVKTAFMMYVLSLLLEAYDNESTAKWVYRLRIFVVYHGNDIFVQTVSSGATVGNFTYGPWVKMTNSNDLGAVSKIITEAIAPVESSYTATQNYSVGDYLIVDYKLYKVTAAIANGGTIAVGTNVTATTIMAEIKALT